MQQHVHQLEVDRPVDLLVHRLLVGLKGEDVVLVAGGGEVRSGRERRRRDPNHEPRVRAWCAVRHCVCSSVHSKEPNCWVCWWEKIQPDVLIMLTRHFKLAQTFQGILGVEKLSPKAF